MNYLKEKYGDEKNEIFNLSETHSALVPVNYKQYIYFSYFDKCYLLSSFSVLSKKITQNIYKYN